MIRFGIIGAPLDNTFTTSGIMSPAFSQQHYLQCEYHAHVLNLHYAMMRETVVPATLTGSRIAVGVTTPVLPMLNSMSNSRVTTSSAGNLYAIAHLGDFACNPSLLVVLNH